MTLNKIFLIGRVGNNPEIKTTSSNQEFARFSVATDEQYTDKNGQIIKKTEWHKIVAWGKQVEFIANYLVKGILVYIEGKIETRKWEDQSGITKYITEIKAEKVVGLESSHSRTSNDIQTNSNGKIINPNTDFGYNKDFPLQSSDMDKLPF